MSECKEQGKPASKTRKAALPGDPIRVEIINRAENNDVPLDLQARRLSRLYALSYTTAVAIAQLAFAAGCPR